MGELRSSYNRFTYYTCITKRQIWKNDQKENPFSYVMIIKVKTLTGKEIAVELNSEDPVYRIKELLEEKEGIPPSQQRLIFQGKQMYDTIYSFQF